MPRTMSSVDDNHFAVDDDNKGSFLLNPTDDGFEATVGNSTFTLSQKEAYKLYEFLGKNVERQG